MIPGERILGKFFHQGGRRSSGAAETLLVAKTWAPLLGNPQGNALCGEGEVIADG
jgi:hypothetical protein